MNEHKSFEKYLAQFQPETPQRLHDAVFAPKKLWWKTMTSIAAAVLLAISIFYFYSPKKITPRKITTRKEQKPKLKLAKIVELSYLREKAFEGNLEQTLSQSSQRIFPKGKENQISREEICTFFEK